MVPRCTACSETEVIFRRHCTGNSNDCCSIGCHIAAVCQRCEYEWLEICHLEQHVSSIEVEK